MAASLLPVSLPTDVWVDIYAATGISVGTKINVQNRRVDEVFMTEASIEPSGLIADMGGNFLVGKNFFTNVDGNIGAWAISTRGGMLQVEEAV